MGNNMKYIVGYIALEIREIDYFQGEECGFNLRGMKENECKYGTCTVKRLLKKRIEVNETVDALIIELWRTFFRKIKVVRTF